MLETSRGPLYPIWKVLAYPDIVGDDPVVIGESEMIGNIINQVAKGLEGGYMRVHIERTGGYVDGRIPGH